MWNRKNNKNTARQEDQSIPNIINEEQNGLSNTEHIAYERSGLFHSVTQEEQNFCIPQDTISQWLANEEELLEHSSLAEHSTSSFSEHQTPIPPLPTHTKCISQTPKTPSIQGITLCPTSEIPNPFDSLFPFSLFNAIQSACLGSIFYENNNMVISAPTGSGKTVLMELAMIRVLLQSDTQIKVIYMAPTKSLCTEKANSWEKKFLPLGITCKEFTGDTDSTSVDAIKKSTIIVTTPEKWDSMTRRWIDHRQLVGMIKLFLIDEVHFLNEQRGAALEACVSRMKTMHHSIRYIAVSATVPNLQDIASWLDAEAVSFSEEFRPIPLQRIVNTTYFKGDNMFLFDKRLDWKLLDLIQKYSTGKPTLIFCSTRKSAQSSCDTLVKMIENKRIQTFGSKDVDTANIKDKALAVFVKKGIGFHHAGLHINDRHCIEQLFTKKQIQVLATTSTLAVGVNLPAHLVIIKSTKGYQNGGLAEYSDLDVLQMIGRAGRPGLDDSGVAVIMTTQDMEMHYKSLVSGSSNIESSLHDKLAEHLLSEICLNTISDDDSAIDWLRSTFLYRRVQKNAEYYRLKDAAYFQQTPNKLLNDICLKDIHLLLERGLIEKQIEGEQAKYKPTVYGLTMDRYYIKLQTMFTILEMPKCLSIRDVLWTVCAAQEFMDMRYNSGEKPFLNQLQKDPNFRFPLTEKVSSIQDKIFTIIQCILGDIPLQGSSSGHKLSMESYPILQHASRITKCMIDCTIHKRDSIMLKYSLDFYRSLQAKIWSNSPYVLRQINGIGLQTVKALMKAGISTFRHIEEWEAYRIEAILHRRPPFGNQIKTAVSNIPQYSLKVAQLSNETAEDLDIVLHVNVSLTNKKIRHKKYERGFYTQFWAETNDSVLLDFRRIPLYKLQAQPQSFKIKLAVTSESMTIICHVQSEDYVGLNIFQEIKPNIDPAMFKPIEPVSILNPTKDSQEDEDLSIFENLDSDSGIDTSIFTWKETDDEVDGTDDRTLVPSLPLKRKSAFDSQNTNRKKPSPAESVVIGHDEQPNNHSIDCSIQQDKVEESKDVSLTSCYFDKKQDPVTPLPIHDAYSLPSRTVEEDQDSIDLFWEQEFDPVILEAMLENAEDSANQQVLEPETVPTPTSVYQTEISEDVDPCDEIWNKTGDYAYRAFEQAFHETPNNSKNESTSTLETVCLNQHENEDKDVPENNRFTQWLTDYVTVIDDNEYAYEA
ncbi:Sec63 Brl domain-containing protein [Spinellus fusiger]|nr:Sec63 Brl domain-containing protein [Spinellus fusiger]